MPSSSSTQHMRYTLPLALMSLLFSGLVASQMNGFLTTDDSSGHPALSTADNRREFLPPAPPQAEPITEQYLTQLGAGTYAPSPSSAPVGNSKLMPPAANQSRLPQMPYANALPGYPNRPYGGNASTDTGGQYGRNAPGPGPGSWTPQAGRTPPSLDAYPMPQQPVADAPDDADPGRLLPPELAEQRTRLRRQSRQENHALLGELMSAQDTVEDVLKMERPSPEAVGKAYAKVFDIQRRMIELRVRTQNGLLEIWDKAREQAPEAQPSLPLTPR